MILINQKKIISWLYISLPQIATVGFTEQQLKDNNNPTRQVISILANGKSQTMSNSYGFVKTLFNSETGEVLGISYWT